MVMNPWLGMALVMGALITLMGGLRWLQWRYAPHPEWVRKLLHVSMGLVVLSFPWLFHADWPVLVLAGVTVVGLAAVRRSRQLREQVGSVLGAVDRASLGELYFPIAVALVFVMARREPAEPPQALLYCVPILILALADAGAALVGIRYGRLHYPTVDGEKSTEGSFAFFAVAFASTLGCLALWGGLDAERVWLIALLLGFLAMLVEAIAWNGLDNLVLPLASFLLLRNYLKLDAAELVARVAATSALVGFALFFRARTTLAGSALVGAVLVGYLSWALGGWPWLLPPLLFFTSYKLWPSGRSDAGPRRHNVHAVLCVSSAGLVWLFVHGFTDRPGLLLPYTVAFAAHLAIIGLVRLKRAFAGLSLAAAVPLCVLVGGLLLVVPAATQGECWPALGLSLGGIGLATLLFCGTQPGLDDCPTNTPRWLRQAAAAGLGSLLGWAAITMP
jgi:phytol kinase